MPRNNADFHNSIMYHGSSSSFNVGDAVIPMSNMPPQVKAEIIKKRPRDRSNSSVEPERAFASNHAGVAKLYAGKTGKVYTVEPLDNDEVETKQPALERGEKNPILYYTSKKGFKVTGVHDG